MTKDHSIETPSSHLTEKRPVQPSAQAPEFYDDTTEPDGRPLRADLRQLDALIERARSTAKPK